LYSTWLNRRQPKKNFKCFESNTAYTRAAKGSLCRGSIWVNETFLGIFFAETESAKLFNFEKLDKGKPLERVGRKATGLSSGITG